MIRDATLKEWRFVERGVEISADFGSGYPAGENIVWGGGGMCAVDQCDGVVVEGGWAGVCCVCVLAK